MSDVNQWIDEQVKANDVVLFMKGTPQFPQCGFSGRVVQILDYVGVEYAGINVLDSDVLRNGIKEYSDWPTIPQLYVKGEFVGGCDILTEMFQNGELQSHMSDNGIEIAESSAPGLRPPPTARNLTNGPVYPEVGPHRQFDPAVRRCPRQLHSLLGHP